MTPKIRLSSDLRSKIKAALISKKFDKRKANLKSDREKLAVDVYDAAFSPSERRKMNGLPDGWLPTIDAVMARLGNLEFHGRFPSKKTYRVPDSKNGRYGAAPCLIAVGAEDPLAVRFAAMRAEERAIETEENDLKREIDAVLFSVTTVNKLVDVWPEIKKTVEEICKTYVAGSTLPAPRVDFLNNALGLTKPKAA